MRLSPKSKAFEEYNFLMDMYVRLKNPQVHFDLKTIPLEFLLKDVDDLEFAIEMFFLANDNERRKQ